MEDRRAARSAFSGAGTWADGRAGGRAGEQPRQAGTQAGAANSFVSFSKVRDGNNQFPTKMIPSFTPRHGLGCRTLACSLNPGHCRTGLEFLQEEASNISKMLVSIDSVRYPEFKSISRCRARRKKSAAGLPSAEHSRTGDGCHEESWFFSKMTARRYGQFGSQPSRKTQKQKQSCCCVRSNSCWSTRMHACPPSVTLLLLGFGQQTGNGAASHRAVGSKELLSVGGIAKIFFVA